MIMEGDPFVLIEGMAIAGIAVERDQGLRLHTFRIPSRDRNHERSASRPPARLVYLEPSVLGSSYAFDIEVRVGAGAYVCGEETALLESLEGRRGIVRAKPPLPAHKGLFGKPTVINNVISLGLRARSFIDKGAAFYKDFGMGRSRGTITLQIAGNVKYGGLFETAFGLTLGEIVDDIGGGTATRPPGQGRAGRRTAGCLFPAFELFDTPFRL